jgi:hypothetical protein
LNDKLTDQPLYIPLFLLDYLGITYLSLIFLWSDQYTRVKNTSYIGQRQDSVSKAIQAVIGRELLQKAKGVLEIACPCEIVNGVCEN